jgi:CBS domain-containing protein
MSSPLETVQPDATVRAAVDRMTAAGVTKLPVLEGLSLEGIVTMTDVVTSYHDIVREVHELEARREEWESESLEDDDGSNPPRRED